MNLAEKINEFLLSTNDGDVEINDSIVEEFGELCKQTLRNLRRSSDSFSIRLSSIGYDARKLWLDKTYGRQPMNAATIMKMTFGNLTEHLVYSLLKLSGVEIVKKSGKVVLDVDDTKIPGEYDLKVKIDGKEYLIDIKSASPYAFTNKFNAFENLKESDEFGYIGQGVGYSQADKTPWGGWLVTNKATGEINHLLGEEVNNEELVHTYLDKFRYNISVLNGSVPVPECGGVIDETFYKKETGNKCLSKSCNYCDHKYTCHSGLRYLPSLASKAKEPEWKYYTYVKDMVDE